MEREAIRMTQDTMSAEAVAGSGPRARWRELGLCAQTDPEAFFPEKGASAREAKRICSRCEVRLECLDDAIRSDERFGIWGGLSERERRTLRRRTGAATSR
jgi:WhiB family redox-sensing transcriptional regulator